MLHAALAREQHFAATLFGPANAIPTLMHDLTLRDAHKHGGATVAENLALSCIACNQLKGSDLSSLDPLTNELTPLFHPRLHRWREHFVYRGLFVEPKTAIGRVTVRLLRFNAPDRITERGWLAAAGELAEPPA